MKATPEAIDDFLCKLAGTPHRIAIFCSDLEENQYYFKPDKKTWSVNENLAHLRACADVWGKSIEVMLDKDLPTIPHLSPRTWIRKTNYPSLPFHESLGAFRDQRRQLLDKLENLDFVDWSRGALIKGRQHTIFSQARRMALHETTHCEQVEALIESIRTQQG
jgi:hypothetical protein